MHKFILMILLAIKSTSIAAEEWTEIGKIESKNAGIVTLYADLSTVSINGDKRKIWTLIDDPKPLEGGISSQKSQRELDCKEGTSRLIYASIYYGNMGSGQSNVIPLTQEEKEEFEPIIPGTPISTLLKTICDTSQ